MHSIRLPQKVRAAAMLAGLAAIFAAAAVASAQTATGPGSSTYYGVTNANPGSLTGPVPLSGAPFIDLTGAGISGNGTSASMTAAPVAQATSGTSATTTGYQYAAPSTTSPSVASTTATSGTGMNGIASSSAVASTSGVAGSSTPMTAFALSSGTYPVGQAPTANPDTLAAAAGMSQDTPRPEVLSVDQDGGVLIRGVAQAGLGLTGSSTGTLMLDSWGGSWTIRTSGATIAPAASAPGDLSGISDGDFLGVIGTIDTNQPLTIDATYVRDWTTTGSNAGASSADTEPAAGTGTTATSSDGITPGTLPAGTIDSQESTY